MRVKNSLVKQYNISFSAEIVIKNKVSNIVNFLKMDTEVSKQDKVEMVNELAALVPIYNNCVLSYMKSLQRISILIESTLIYIKEIKIHEKNFLV